MSDDMDHASEDAESLEQHPLRCAWCPDAPADHMAIIDISGTWERRETVLLCAEDAHSVALLPTGWERWWLFRLTPDDASSAEECGNSRELEAGQ